MAELTKISDAAANTAADALCNLLDSGTLRIYDGIRAANANTAPTTQVILAQVVFNSTAFAPAVAGVATANSMTADASADATGVATWFRAVTSTGGTVYDGDVGLAAANLNLNSVAISSGVQVSITSLTYTVLEST